VPEGDVSLRFGRYCDRDAFGLDHDARGFSYESQTAIRRAQRVPAFDGFGVSEGTDFGRRPHEHRPDRRGPGATCSNSDR
jgi:hypothetical protein